MLETGKEHKFGFAVYYAHILYCVVQTHKDRSSKDETVFHLLSFHLLAMFHLYLVQIFTAGGSVLVQMLTAAGGFVSAAEKELEQRAPVL